MFKSLITKSKLAPCAIPSADAPLSASVTLCPADFNAEASNLRSETESSIVKIFAI
jgi:hypothetical protein